MKKLSSLICGALLSWNTVAAEVEGVHLPDNLHVGSNNLVLNGSGVRSKFFIDLYVAALFVSEKKDSSEAILSDTGAKRIALHMMRDISAETLSKSFNKAIADNLTPAEMEALEPQLKQFTKLLATMGEAKEGDVITLDYLPGTGTDINFNDVTMGTIAGAAFNNALLRVWLGDKPVQESLKKRLLGSEGE